MALQPAVIIASCPWRQGMPAAVSCNCSTMSMSMRHDGLLSGKGMVVGRSIRIKCMANPRRVKMVAKQIRRELSDMLLTDKVLQFAVLPEASLGADRYLSSLTTITDVQVSADLQVPISFSHSNTFLFLFFFLPFSYTNLLLIPSISHYHTFPYTH